MDSMWTPHGFTVFFGSEFTGLHVDSLWTPCGLHMDLVIFYYAEFAGTPSGLRGTCHFLKRKILRNESLDLWDYKYV